MNISMSFETLSPECLFFNAVCPVTAEKCVVYMTKQQDLSQCVPVM